MLVHRYRLGKTIRLAFQCLGLASITFAMVGCHRTTTAEKDVVEGGGAANDSPTEAESLDADGVVLTVNAIKRKSARVEIGSVELRPWTDYRMVPAKLELDPDRHFAITAPIDVVVEDVLVGLGKQVEAGAPLLQLSAPEITKFRGDLINARTRLQILDEVATWHRQALVTLESLVQQMDDNSPQGWNSQLDQLEKYSKHAVFGKQGGSLMEALLRVRSAKSVINVSREQGVQQALPQRLIVERETELASAKSALQAIAQQSLFDLGQMVKEADADCQHARSQLKTVEAELNHLMGVAPTSSEEDKHLLKPGASGEASYIYRTPRAGTVIQRNFASGERAALGETLVLVADLSKLWVVGELRPQDWDLLRLANDARLNVEVTGLEQLGAIQGQLVYLGGQVEATSGAIRIAVSVDNEQHLLRPGMTARLVIDQQQAESVLQVPASAIFTHDHVDYLLIMEEESRFKMHRAQLGRKNSRVVELLDKLPVGTKIMTQGVFPIASEALLENEE